MARPYYNPNADLHCAIVKYDGKIYFGGGFLSMVAAQDRVFQMLAKLGGIEGFDPAAEKRKATPEQTHRMLLSKLDGAMGYISQQRVPEGAIEMKF